MEKEPQRESLAESREEKKNRAEPHSITQLSQQQVWHTEKSIFFSVQHRMFMAIDQLGPAAYPLGNAFSIPFCPRRYQTMLLVVILIVLCVPSTIELVDGLSLSLYIFLFLSATRMRMCRVQTKGY